VRLCQGKEELKAPNSKEEEEAEKEEQPMILYPACCPDAVSPF
jgi:hypothetical protein